MKFISFFTHITKHARREKKVLNTLILYSNGRYKITRLNYIVISTVLTIALPIAENRNEIRTTIKKMPLDRNNPPYWRSVYVFIVLPLGIMGDIESMSHLCPVLMYAMINGSSSFYFNVCRQIFQKFSLLNNSEKMTKFCRNS